MKSDVTSTRTMPSCELLRTNVQKGLQTSNSHTHHSGEPHCMWPTLIRARNSSVQKARSANVTFQQEASATGGRRSGRWLSSCPGQWGKPTQRAGRGRDDHGSRGQRSGLRAIWGDVAQDVLQAAVCRLTSVASEVLTWNSRMISTFKKVCKCPSEIYWRSRKTSPSSTESALGPRATSPKHQRVRHPREMEK